MAIAFAIQTQQKVTEPAQILQLDTGLHERISHLQQVILLGAAVTQRALGAGVSFYAVRGHAYTLPKGVAYIGFALSDLLAKPALKAQLWQELRAIIQQ